MHSTYKKLQILLAYALQALLRARESRSGCEMVSGNRRLLAGWL